LLIAGFFFFFFFAVFLRFTLSFHLFYYAFRHAAHVLIIFHAPRDFLMPLSPSIIFR